MSSGTYHARRAMHRCTLCGEKLDPDDQHATCLVCRMDRRGKPDGHSAEAKARHAQWLKERREANRANGICVVCGRHPAKPGRTMCDLCLSKSRARQAKDRHARGAMPRVLMDGIDRCTRCGASKEDNGHKVCDKCYPILRNAMLNARSQRTEKNYFEQVHRYYAYGG